MQAQPVSTVAYQRTYRYSEQEDYPIDHSVNDGSQILVEFAHQDRNGGSRAESCPPREDNEHGRREECHRLLPSGPVERIVGVVGCLRHKDHIAVFLALQAVGGFGSARPRRAGQDTIDELHCSDIGIEFVQRAKGEHCRLADGKGGCETMLSTSAQKI